MYETIRDWAQNLPFWMGICVWLGGNLTLALIPVLIARSMKAGIERDFEKSTRLRWWVWGPVALLWLLFLPNTAYLITEWRHYLATVCANPSYYPVLHGYAYPAEITSRLVILTGFFGAYSLFGLAAMVYAMRPVDLLLSRYCSRAHLWAIPVLFLLCSIGVYLGLVDRLNSWDMINMRTLISLVGAPVRIATSPWLATLIVWFAGFLWLFYRIAVRRIDDNGSAKSSASA